MAVQTIIIYLVGRVLKEGAASHNRGGPSNEWGRCNNQSICEGEGAGQGASTQQSWAGIAWPGLWWAVVALYTGACGLRVAPHGMSSRALVGGAVRNHAPPLGLRQLACVAVAGEVLLSTVPGARGRRVSMENARTHNARDAACGCLWVVVTEAAAGAAAAPLYTECMPALAMSQGNAVATRGNWCMEQDPQHCWDWSKGRGVLRCRPSRIPACYHHAPAPDTRARPQPAVALALSLP